MTWNGIRGRVRHALASMGLLAVMTCVVGSTTNASEPGESELRVLSYNIQGLPLPGTNHERYRKIGIFLRMLRATGKGFHVVALQESFHKRTRELVEEAGYPYVSYGPRAKGLRVNSGLVILSEYPIVDAKQMVYRFCAGSDCLSRKGVQLARIEVPGVGPIDVFNTHMNASYSGFQWPPGEFGELVRVRQLTQMREFFHDSVDRKTPTFFAGDFNFRVGSASYALFDRFSALGNAAEDCARASCPGESDPMHEWETEIDHQFYSAFDSGARITPILFRRNFREVVGGAPLSDHLGHEVHYAVER